MEDNIYIDGIAISEYRSFGKDLKKIGPFGKINLFIGQNNSGKSNILLFLRDKFKSFIDSDRRYKIEGMECHLGGQSTGMTIGIGLRLGSSQYEKMRERICPRISGGGRDIGGTLPIIEKLLKSKALIDKECTWFLCKSTDNFNLHPDVIQNLIDEKSLSTTEWREIWALLTHQNGGSMKEHWIPETLNILNPQNSNYPDICFVPAIREIKTDGDKFDKTTINGRGIIKQLAELEKPKYDKIALRKQFQSINRFLQTVTCNPSAILEIPSTQDIIQVEMNGNVLPLSSLGTGIHEVIILAAAATICQNQIVCLEEPEIHLHPRLQKLLLQYLKESTNNQYFIATHSAHFMDTPGVSIFYVHLEGGQTVVETVCADAKKSRICDDLGYRASDLLQTNCIIWVEGPSDRIYLNHWIHSKDSSLVDGIHYSIMFYGGRLLSHLTYNDNEINEFILLQRLNRHSAIVIDSDKKNAADDINQTKKRIHEEFTKQAGFVWITEGKEIENYVHSDIRKEALNSLYGSDIEIVCSGQYENVIEYKKQGENEKKTADKVKLAHKITDFPARFDVLNLDNKVDDLIAFIKQSNA